MEQLFIYENLKAYMYTYPTCLLDNILCIADGNSDDPFVRYKGFPGSLYEHFTLAQYAASIPGDKTKFKLPHISLEITPRRSENCITMYTLSFIIDYQINAPGDCDNGCPCISGSSAGMLGWQDSIVNGLNQMMHGGFAFNELYNSSIAHPDFLNTDGIFKFNALVSYVSNPLMSPVSVSDEMITFAIDYDIDVSSTHQQC